jgi:hypothetical protein
VLYSLFVLPLFALPSLSLRAPSLSLRSLSFASLLHVHSSLSVVIFLLNLLVLFAAGSPSASVIVPSVLTVTYFGSEGRKNGERRKGRRVEQRKEGEESRERRAEKGGEKKINVPCQQLLLMKLI